MTTAGERLEGTTELIEQILYDLPPIDILIYQRVSKRWQEIIQAKKFQRALFFESASDELLVASWDGYAPSGAILASPFCPQIVYANPMLQPLGDALANPNNWYTHHTATVLEALPPSWKKQGASWRKMLLTQPGTSNRLRTTHYLSYSVHISQDRNKTNTGQDLWICVENFCNCSPIADCLGSIGVVSKVHNCDHWEVLQTNHQLEDLPKATGETIHFEDL